MFTHRQDLVIHVCRWPKCLQKKMGWLYIGGRNDFILCKGSWEM